MKLKKFTSIKTEEGSEDEEKSVLVNSSQKYFNNLKMKHWRLIIRNLPFQVIFYSLIFHFYHFRILKYQARRENFSSLLLVWIIRCQADQTFRQTMEVSPTAVGVIFSDSQFSSAVRKQVGNIQCFLFSNANRRSATLSLYWQYVNFNLKV